VARVKAPRLRLLMVGRGMQAGSLRQTAAALGLGSRVELRGGLPPDRLPVYHQAADVFVFASTSETQGLAVLEAMAAGLPIVAVRASGIEEIVSDGVSGLLVPEDLGAFATAVDEILADPHLRAKLAMGARDGAAPFGSIALAHRLIVAYQRAQGAPAWS